MEHLHKYKVLDEGKSGILEVCTRSGCGKRLVTPKSPLGNIDNEIYRKEHQRDFLQPNDPRFEIEYGKVQIPDTNSIK